MPTIAAEAGVAAPAGPELTRPELDADPTGTVPRDLWAVVFAGGIGSRFWPLSTPERPKQLLALLSERPLIADTLERLAPIIPVERILVLTSRDIADAIHGAIPELPAGNLLVEPRPLGTAAALAWGAQEVARRQGPGAVLVAMHADLAVAFPGPFLALLHTAAARAARDEKLVAIGVQPTRPDPSFGYLHPGEPASRGESASTAWSAGAPAHPRRFVEKPSAVEAEALVRDGHLWYAGILVTTARAALEALATHTPEIAPGLHALRAGDTARFAECIRSTSVERGLLERTTDFVVLAGEFGWDDVGTWACLRRARDLDDAGNGRSGPVHLVDASANVVHAEHGTVVMYGVSQLLVVSLPGLTFVTTLERARELRPLLDALPSEMRHHPTTP